MKVIAFNTDPVVGKCQRCFFRIYPDRDTNELIFLRRIGVLDSIRDEVVENELEPVMIRKKVRFTLDENFFSDALVAWHELDPLKVVVDRFAEIDPVN